MQLAEKLIFKRSESLFAAGLGVMAGEPAELTAYRYLLHPAELSRLDGMQFARRRNSYFLGRTAAKAALSLVNRQPPSELLISEGVFQFPVVKNLQQDHFQVSITHAEKVGLALAGPEEHPLGIDVEKKDPKALNALQGQATPAETSLALSCYQDKLTALTHIWTAKEALSKVFRTGMMMDFFVYELAEIKACENYLVSTFKNCGQYKAITFPAGSDLMISLVMPEKSELQNAAGIVQAVSTHITTRFC